MNELFNAPLADLRAGLQALSNPAFMTMVAYAQDGTSSVRPLALQALSDEMADRGMLPNGWAATTQTVQHEVQEELFARYSQD